MIYADVYLTTLDTVKKRLKLSNVDVNDDELVESHIATATDLIAGFCARSFVPYRDTKTFDARGDHIDGLIMLLREDLLAVETLTNGDGTAVTSSQYALPRGYPKWKIELLSSSGLTWLYTTDWQNAISIDGVWGYHEDYSRAWVNTNDTVKDSGGIDASAQSVTVADANGKDARYHTRFAVGQLLRIEDEFLKVVAIDTGTNVLTVLRGINGTTAAAHDEDTSIESYAPMRNIEQACLSLATWLYRYAPTAGAPLQVLIDGTKQIQSNMPRFIQDALQPYQGVRVS
jgi:hypothetical protein